MPKHVDAVPALDNFRAPWETESGDEAEIDKAKLKKYIHGLVTDKAKAQDAREDAKAQVTTLESENADLKTQAESSNGAEATKKISKLEKDLAAMTTERDAALKEKTRADLLREAGLSDTHAKYVTGEDEDAIKKSIEDVKKDFGLDDDGKPAADEAGDEDRDDDLKGFVRPVSRLKTPGDPKGGKEPVNFDPDKIAAGLLDRNLF